MILRQYEKDHSDDLALKSLYYRQHERDDYRTLFPNQEVDEEEVEVAKVLSNVDNWDNDGAVFGAEAASRDGNWGNGLDKEFEDYDKYLHDHPEETKEDCGTELCAMKSMLHFATLKETETNNENRFKSRSQQKQQQDPKTRYY